MVQVLKVAKTPEVREARRLFLYGDGDGRRVLNVAKLAELAGCEAADGGQGGCRQHETLESVTSDLLTTDVVYNL